MENKYYTPELSEFFVGFEYEQKDALLNWIPTAFSLEVYKDYLVRNNEQLFTKHLEQGNIRVKALDGKDLLELGWVEHLKSTELTVEEGFWRVRIVNEGEIELDYEDNVDWEASFTLYKCKVKNKSEMRKLMEMLNIKTQ